MDENVLIDVRNKIKEKKYALCQLLLVKPLDSAEVLELSRELDKLITEYYIIVCKGKGQT